MLLLGFDYDINFTIVIAIVIRYLYVWWVNIMNTLHQLAKPRVRLAERTRVYFGTVTVFNINKNPQSLVTYSIHQKSQELLSKSALDHEHSQRVSTGITSTRKLKENMQGDKRPTNVAINRNVRRLYRSSKYSLQACVQFYKNNKEKNHTVDKNKQCRLNSPLSLKNGDNNNTYNNNNNNNNNIQNSIHNKIHNKIQNKIHNPSHNHNHNKHNHNHNNNIINHMRGINNTKKTNSTSNSMNNKNNMNCNNINSNHHRHTSNNNNNSNNNMNNSINGDNNNNKQSNNSVKVSHLWPCGQWTTADELLHINYDCNNNSKNNNNNNNRETDNHICSSCNYDLISNAKVVDISSVGNFFVNKNRPKLTIISPNSIDNTLLLSKICVARYVFFYFFFFSSPFIL